MTGVNRTAEKCRATQNGNNELHVNDKIIPSICSHSSNKEISRDFYAKELKESGLAFKKNEARSPRGLALYISNDAIFIFFKDSLIDIDKARSAASISSIAINGGSYRVSVAGNCLSLYLCFNSPRVFDVGGGVVRSVMIMDL